MSILDTYSGVYGGYLSPDERKDLGKFAADLLEAKVSNDSQKINDLIKQATQTLTENYEDFEAFVGLVGWLEKHAADVPQSKKTNISNILHTISATMALAPAAYAGAKWVSRKAALAKSKRQILQDNPALKNEPRFEQYFDMIASFSPEVASQPILAGNVLEQIRRLGPAAVTPQMINDLLGLQGRLSPSTAEMVSTISSGIGKASDIGTQAVKQEREAKALADKENEKKLINRMKALADLNRSRRPPPRRRDLQDL